MPHCRCALLFLGDPCGCCVQRSPGEVGCGWGAAFPLAPASRLLGAGSMGAWHGVWGPSVQLLRPPAPCDSGTLLRDMARAQGTQPIAKEPSDGMRVTLGLFTWVLPKPLPPTPPP